MPARLSSVLVSLLLGLLVGCGSTQEAPTFENPGFAPAPTGGSLPAGGEAVAEAEEGKDEEGGEEEQQPGGEEEGAKQEEDGEADADSAGEEATEGQSEEEEGPVALVLQPEASELGFVAVKNGSADVPFTAATLSGELTMYDYDLRTLSGSISVSLAGLGSGDQVRDTRVRDIFFGFTEHPEVVFTFSGLEIHGGTEGPWAGTVNGSVSMAGVSGPVSAALGIVKNDDGALTISNTEPVLLNIDTLGLAEPLSQLITICGHQSVSAEVPVRFSLVFNT